VEVQQLSYLHLSRTLEEKCSLIAKQKEEIEVLKQCVQDIRNNKEFKTTEEQRLNNAEVLRLKQQEKEYLDNLREIDILKSNIREVRRKYEAMANEKNLTSQRYNKLLK
jgi:prolyl oligopeptidase PreP (S9A serine peptidase family)